MFYLLILTVFLLILLNILIVMNVNLSAALLELISFHDEVALRKGEIDNGIIILKLVD